MEISKANNCVKVGEIILGTDSYNGTSVVYHKNALQINYDPEFPLSMKKKQLSIVYLFTVNGVIYKIGQSSGKGGIEGCLNFYLKSGQDDPGINRFSINLFIRAELKKRNKVEVYMAYMDLIEVEVLGLTKNEIVEVPISAKGMEQIFMKQYHSKVKSYPKWNYQENGEPLPSSVAEAFGNYKILRARGRS